MLSRERDDRLNYSLRFLYFEVTTNCNFLQNFLPFSIEDLSSKLQRMDYLLFFVRYFSEEMCEFFLLDPDPNIRTKNKNQTDMP